MKKSFLKLLILVLVLLFALLYCLIQTPAFKEGYFKRNFMEGCDPDGTITAYCECNLKYLNDNYSYDERIKMSQENLDSNKTSPAIYDAMDHCATKEVEEKYRESFMKGCDPDGNKTAYCECVVGYLKDNYSYGKRIKMTKELSESGQTPQAIYDAAGYCAQKK